MRELNFKQRLFVEAYLGPANGNAAEAARQVGYAWPEKLGPRLVAKSSVQAAIKARVKTAAISANEVLARLSDIASINILDFIEVRENGEWDVCLKLVKRRGKGHLIRKMKKSDFGTELELRDSLAALIKLGEYHGLWDREKPPEISLVELAKRLKERHDRARSVGNTDGPA
jgi:hypothetical protein